MEPAIVVRTVGLVGNRLAYEAVGRLWAAALSMCPVHGLPIAECRLSISSTVFQAMC